MMASLYVITPEGTVKVFNTLGTGVANFAILQFSDGGPEMQICNFKTRYV
jgi:hypothetical protein